MDIEVAAVERLPDEQNRFGISNLVFQLSSRQNTTGGRRTRQRRSKIVLTKRWLYSCIKSSKMRCFVPALFTSMVITVGVLIVCLTSPHPSQACGQRTFRRTMNSSLISSSQPRSVAVGDLNNDRHIDIIVVNSGTNAIGIFLANGDGTFGDQQTYSTSSGSHPYSIVVSDVNNDTHLDIAVANHGTNNIGIFLGHGNGTFADQKNFSLGSSRPLFITSGDFNKDNRTDLVVSNDDTNNIGILLGYGNGSFQDQITYSTGYDSLPYSLVVGDFNNDIELDIAVTNYGTNNIGIFLGYGNGTFSSQQIYTTLPKSNPSSIAIGDLNNDTQLDIVVANNGTGNVGIFLGHGNGTFLPQITYPIDSNSHPQYITVGDVSKDNKLDIVIVDSSNDQVHILPGYGNGSFAKITTYDGIPGSSPFWVVVADFNNNNQSDIVVVNYGTNNVLVLMNYSMKHSARRTTVYHSKPSDVASVAVSDFNNDSILDIVSNAGVVIVILTGLGNGTFSTGVTYSGDGSVIQYVCVGDVNNDNRTDIISASLNSGSVGVFLGHGNGTFATITSFSTGNSSQPWWIALGDFNHDNRLDIVSANTGSNTIGILLGNGDGTFATVVTYFIGNGSMPYSVAVGDINNDNHLDVAVVNGDGTVVIFIGQGNGTFILMATYSTGENSDPTSITLFDLNRDDHLDIAVANTFTDNVGVFLGYGNGTFTEQTPYSSGIGSEPYYVIVADFNHDNISDISATNYDTDEIVIFYGYGNGTFAIARNYLTGLGSKPYGIVTADLNNNTQLEMIVALWGPGDIAVLTEYDAAEFVNQKTYSTGSAPQPFSVAVGDFNHDNRSDIVVANSGTDNLDVLLGVGNGLFGKKTAYLIGTDSYPQYVITCDINKDTNLDIFSVNSKNNSISVIMGYGNGTFAQQLIYPTGDNSHPYAVASGDLNNDTRLDLVVANEGTHSIGIFFGFNYTSFQSQMTYANNDSSTPCGIVVSDFNNDNFQDIAATFNGRDKIGILLGYGNGSFTPIMTYSTGSGSEPWGIDAGDFNNDNRSDIVVTKFGTNEIGVLLGYGNGSFAAIMTYSTGDGSTPKAVAVSDLNNDGRLDIVVANYGSNNVGVLLGYGNGSFSIVQTYSTGQGSYPHSVTVGDFDNDHRLDIVVANGDTGCVGVLLGYGNGTFKDQIIFSTGDYSQPFCLTVNDFNRDNQLDIATADWNGNNVGILLGYGNGSFANITFYSSGDGSQPRYISVDDFNNDNISDIAVANSGTNNIVILFGFGDGSFLLGTSYSTGINSQPFALAIGDFNNDSRLDIAVANNWAYNIGVFFGYGSQPFGDVTKYSVSDGSQPHSVAVGDLNHDGWSDIVVANYGTDNVSVLLTYSNGTFHSTTTCATGSGSAPYSVAVADFNNDTHLDIVVTNSETDNIAICLGYGNGIFASRITYTTSARSQPYTVVIADFNNDNILDLAMANSGTSNVFLLYGHGNGTFGNQTSYPLGYGYHPYSIAVADLNQDHRMDIVIACFDTDHVETLIQMC